MTENKVNWEEASKMLIEGYTFVDIAERYNVTRQYIQQHYMRDHRGHKKIAKEGIVYPGIREWFMKNRITYAMIGRNVYPNDLQMNATQKARNLLVGKTKYVDIEAALRLIEFTGIPFEQMFKGRE